MSAAIFIGLNIIDAYLTKMGLAMGAEEFNPLMIHLGSSALAKGLIALGIIIALYWFRKERALWLLNLAFLGVVLWNLAIIGVLKVAI